MQMLAPEEWELGRKMVGEVLEMEPPVLRARVPTVLIVAGSDCSGGAGIQVCAVWWQGLKALRAEGH